MFQKKSREELLVQRAQEKEKKAKERREKAKTKRQPAESKKRQPLEGEETSSKRSAKKPKQSQVKVTLTEDNLIQPDPNAQNALSSENPQVTSGNLSGPLNPPFSPTPHNSSVIPSTPLNSTTIPSNLNSERTVIHPMSPIDVGFDGMGLVAHALLHKPVADRMARDGIEVIGQQCINNLLLVADVILNVVHQNCPSEEKVKKLEADLESLQPQHAELKKMKNMASDLEASRRKVIALPKSEADLKEALSLANQSAQTATSSIKRLEDEKATLQSEKDKLQSQKEALIADQQKAIDDYKNELKAAFDKATLAQYVDGHLNCLEQVRLTNPNADLSKVGKWKKVKDGVLDGSDDSADEESDDDDDDDDGDEQQAKDVKDHVDHGGDAEDEGQNGNE